VSQTSKQVTCSSLCERELSEAHNEKILKENKRVVVSKNFRTAHKRQQPLKFNAEGDVVDDAGQDLTEPVYHYRPEYAISESLAKGKKENEDFMENVQINIGDKVIKPAFTKTEKISKIVNKIDVTTRRQVEENNKIAKDSQQIKPTIFAKKAVSEELTVHGNPKRRRGDEVLFKHDDKDSLEKKWLFYVEQGQKIVESMGQDRLKVAELAIAACDIAHGGGNHWKKFEGVYTLNRFAKEIGVSYKTLHNWVRIKRNVYDKLVEVGAKPDATTQWHVMSSVASRCKADEKPKEVLAKFEKWDVKKDFNHQRYLMQALRKFRTFRFYVEKKSPDKKLFDAGDLAEMKDHIAVIGKWIK